MKNKLFLSLNVKILLVMLLVFAGVSTFFLSTFMMNYVEQINRESQLNRKKAERVWEMFEENRRLRHILSIEYLNSNEGLPNDTEGNVRQLLSEGDRFLSMRQELLQDMKGAKERERKMTLLGYFIFLAFMIIFLALMTLWIVMRRWILAPVENLLDVTRQIAGGDLEARVPVSAEHHKNDELDLLAKDFNNMAESISTSVRKIEENRRFLQNLINTIPDGVCVFDENYNIVQTNLAYEKMSLKNFRACDKKCAGGSVLSGLSCNSEQNPCPMFLLRINPQKTVKMIRPYLDNENKEKYFEVTSAALIQEVDGRKVMWMIELVRSLDKEIDFSHHQKLSAVGMLASSVAHEMRNPLGSVRLVLENIIDRLDTKPLSAEELKHYLNLIYDQMTYCIGVTSRLLKLSRKPEKNALPVNFNEIVSETSSLLEYEAKKRGIEVIIEQSPDPAFVLSSDPDLRMVTVNLMQNAFHAMSEGGTLRISIMVQDEKVHVSFADTGCGIPSENLQRIFEPFFSQKKETENKGTGLGLSITKTIVENYDGRITVQSTMGKGTEFKLVFPRIAG